MADINLKTETPDTTLPTTGFLFGADSQAAASPSVYTTQAVATTLLGSTTLSGATITADAPVLNMSQTWNNAAVTFTGLKYNATDTASNAASLLMDLQVGGTSQLRIDKTGRIVVPVGGQSTPFLANVTDQTSRLFWESAYVFGLALGGTYTFSATLSGVKIPSDDYYAWTSSSAASGVADLFLTRRGAANLRFGAADAAAPVAQTLSVQSVVAGTTNTAGANLTITGSQGTGTGAGGSIIFQVAPAGSSGSAQNALATALTIASTTDATFANAVNAGATSHIGFSSRSRLSSPADGVIRFSNNASADFDRLQFGGTTSSFPALKRSSTTLQARLADDTAFASVQGKLTTDTAYTAGSIVVTGYLTLYDSTGTAYRVPCVV
jgi:hypothetical protein